MYRLLRTRTERARRQLSCSRLEATRRHHRDTLTRAGIHAGIYVCTEVERCYENTERCYENTLNSDVLGPTEILSGSLEPFQAVVMRSRVTTHDVSHELFRLDMSLCDESVIPCTEYKVKYQATGTSYQ